MKYLLILTLTISLLACNLRDEATSISTVDDKKRVWVFAQFNVLEENHNETYFYYGRVSERMYRLIANNKISSGFILLKDAKYWGNDDVIHEYEDADDSGDLVFRIEDIAKINLLKKEPQTGLSANDTTSLPVLEPTPTEEQ